MALTKANVVKSIKEQVGFTGKQSVETVETLLEIKRNNRGRSCRKCLTFNIKNESWRLCQD